MRDFLPRRRTNSRAVALKDIVCSPTVVRSGSSACHDPRTLDLLATEALGAICRS